MSNKYKFSSIFGLLPGVDSDETWDLWQADHVVYAKQVLLPEVKEYWINRVIYRFGDVPVNDIWGIPEFWFDDYESTKTAVGRMQQTAPDDFHLHYITPAKRMILEEEVIDLQ